MYPSQCKPTYISTSATTYIAGTISAAGLATNVVTGLHTVVIPIALVGTAKFRDVKAGGATYFILPIGSIGTLTFDCTLPMGLQVALSSSSSDKIIVNTWQ